MQIWPRLHALWLLRASRSLREVAGMIGVHYVMAQQWVAWYRQGGVGAVRAHRRAGPGRAARLTAAQWVQLAAQAVTGAFPTARWRQVRYVLLESRPRGIPFSVTAFC